MPLNKKGRKIKKAMTKQYGKKKGEKVFYAMENSGKLRKVTKARGGKDMGTVAGATRAARNDRDIGNRMAQTQQAAINKNKSFQDTKSKIGPPVRDEPFKKPLNFAQTTALGLLVPFSGTAINFAAKQNYKGRQKFAKKEGLYRDAYKTTGKVLQPNAPIGKQYLKDAGFGKQPKIQPALDNKEGPPQILPPVSQVAQVNEPLDLLSDPLSSYKRPTVTNGMFNYSVGFKKGGMLRQGKPKIAKKGWK